MKDDFVYIDHILVCSGMRDKLIHDYMGVDKGVVCKKTNPLICN